MKFHLITILLIWLATDVQAQKAQPKATGNAAFKNVNKKANSMSDYSPSLAKAHPNAKRLMNEEFYWSPIEETGPFGSDDGADTYAGFADWRQSHHKENPKKFLLEQIGYWGYPAFDLNETAYDKLKPYLDKSDLGNRYMSGIDAAIVAIAFGQLYLEGTIDKKFKELAAISIKRQLIPQILNLWDDDYRTVRETQLKKMLGVLEQVH